MKAYNDTKYPVFEADQVLSQNHLNNIISYLEEQDRLTRAGLIGIGVICGMEVTFPDINSIRIDCGTAVTSLGFQINWQGKDFDYYQDIELPETFLHPNILTEPFLKPVFDETSPYSIFKSCKELIHVDEPTQEHPNPIVQDGAISIPGASFFDGKVVMLLLEVSLIDVKNCVSTGCDDKGKRLEFKIRPILIDSKLIKAPFLNTYANTASLGPLFIERFNVPQTNLTNGQQILNAFYGMMNSAFLDRINIAVNSLYNSFKSDFQNSVTNYASLINVRTKLDEVIKTYRPLITIQYVWQWLGDIVKAYNEIYDLNETHSLANCCSSDITDMFPLHVLLGRISTKTAKLTDAGLILQQPQYLARRYNPNDYNMLDTDQRFITPWIKIASGAEKNEKIILKGLIQRLIQIINSFNIPNNYLDTKIRITPTIYGRDLKFSQTSIPYYYNKDNINELIKVWNPEKTLKNENTKILSYHSELYSSYPPTRQPLNYDIEPYNFLRVEGHIGKQFTDVVSTLSMMKSASRLPFNIIAVNAIDIENGNLNINTYTGDWGDIQLSYEIVSRHWEDVIGKCIEWLQANYWVTDYISQQEYDNLVIHLKKGRDCTYKLFSQFLPLYTYFMKIYEKIEAMATEYRVKIFNGLTEIIVPRDPKEQPYTRFVFNAYTEELIDHLDQIIMVCSKGQFRALHQNAIKKWNEGSQIQTLKTFLEKHPGIQNGGGVPIGGTIMLVYRDTSMLNTPRSSATRAVITPTKSVIFSPTIEDYSRKLKAYASINLQPQNYSDLVQYIDKYVYLNSIKDTSTIPEKVVIADFYLPYLCGIDGPSINFIVNPTNVTPEGPADFNDPDFNSTDFYAKENVINE